MTVFSKLLNATAYQTPILRTLVPTLGLIYGLQAASAIPSIAAQTERFYDLSGSITYISATAFSLLLPALRARRSGEFLAKHNRIGPSILGLVKGVEGRGYNWRQVVISAAVTIWALRRASPPSPINPN